MKKTNPILSLLSLLSLVIFLKPELHPLFWKISRILLFVIVFSRPLADIFRNKKIWLYLRKIVSIRQWLWVMCWMFALAHGIWYFLSINFQFLTIFSNSAIRNIKTIIWSWLRAMAFMLLPLITSHKFWIKKLWRNWKNIQRLTYPAFLFTAIHVWLARWELIKFSIIILIYSVVYILAYKKFKINLQF